MAVDMRFGAVLIKASSWATEGKSLVIAAGGSHSLAIRADGSL